MDGHANSFCTCRNDHVARIPDSRADNCLLARCICTMGTLVESGILFAGHTSTTRESELLQVEASDIGPLVCSFRHYGGHRDCVDSLVPIAKSERKPRRVPQAVQLRLDHRQDRQKVRPVGCVHQPPSGIGGRASPTGTLSTSRSVANSWPRLRGFWNSSHGAGSVEELPDKHAPAR